MSEKSDLDLPYPALLSDIKQRIGQAQTRAMLSVNAELVRLYWEIGQTLDSQQKEAGWGAAVIPRLAKDIHNELPEIKGFSERNIKRMLAFYREYRHVVFVPQAVSLLSESAFVPQAVAQITPDIVLALPWGHHLLLIEKIKDAQTRFWYMQGTLANGWSRNVLAMQIETAAHQRLGNATNNFAARLPAPQSDLVQQALKDPYLFDFLTLTAPFQERELETGLVQHLEKFLLELGQGFAFVGRQYQLEVGEQDFYIDLLFYHFKLRCFVAIELKRGAFKPEYAGKMNFYCSVVDDVLKHATDAPTIGLILCQEQNKVLAEYALRGVHTPIGVSTFELTRALPAELKSSLPSIEAIEQELGQAT